MVRLPLFALILLIGLSMIIAKNDGKFRKIYQKRLSRDNEPQRALRNLMGKLIDTETNIIYSVNGEKQQAAPSLLAVTTSASLIAIAPPTHEEIACLAACHFCVEDYSIGNRKKKAADNCGPMCDCADSCFRMSAEQVDKIYGQSINSRGENDCWSRTYNEMFNNEKSQSS